MTDLVANELFEGLDLAYEADAALGPRTWYGVGGRAKALAFPSSVEQLGELVKRCRSGGVPLYVLGSGANLLVRDEGVDGVVVHLSDACFQQFHVEGARLRVGAGFDLFKLVLDAARAGLGGLEVVAGIPASVGGAVRMNAGGAFGEIGSWVQRVQVMSETGQVYEWGQEDLVFGYRQSNIAAPFILEVEFALEEDDPTELMKRVKEIFFYKKNSQPMGASSAGCAFKNPPAEVGKGAGQLIDEAGLKGFAIGKAHVSDVHANFIATEEGATAGQVLQVIEHVQETVRQTFGVELEREVVVWP